MTSFKGLKRPAYGDEQLKNRINNDGDKRRVWEIEQRYNQGSLNEDDREWLRSRGYRDSEINDHRWKQENWWNAFYESQSKKRQDRIKNDNDKRRIWEIEQRYNQGSLNEDDREWLRAHQFGDDEINNHGWRQETWWNGFQGSNQGNPWQRNLWKQDRINNDNDKRRVWEIEQRSNGGGFVNDEDRQWLRERGFGDDDVKNRAWQREGWWNGFRPQN